MGLTRRSFAVHAAAMGAALAFAEGCAHAPLAPWRERRDLYPQGVASGDPAADSVILWTRRPPSAESEARWLTVEVASDPGFARVVARGRAEVSGETDWTCRFLAAGLRPGREYWYRFTDEHGFGSRIGRTLTAPADNDDRAVRFTFVSCQMVAEGACNAYRRMIFEDAAKPRGEQLDFVLHLGDFIYEVIWYPEETPSGVRRGRRLRAPFRYPDGERMSDFHLPVTLADYRACYRGHIEDPDLQDARARWPFVCVWDNHEFSWAGWQSQQVFGGETRPAQTRKVAANQAWWEYLPARVAKPGDPALDRFIAPAVADAALVEFDDHGLGLEPNNLAAINSLRIYRTLRWGRNVELFLTDNHSYRSEPDNTEGFTPQGFRWASSQNATEILDAGRGYRGGHPPETIRFAGREVPNPRKDAPPQSFLGREQKAWLLEHLKRSPARWKIWGHSFGTLEWRADYQHLPQGAGPQWPDEGYALFNGGFYAEKAEIFDFIRDEQITGFAIVAGDRHSFWAGLVSKSLPPQEFAPVGVEFITGSISSPGIFEVAEHVIARDYALRALYLHDRPDGTIAPAMNMTALHGVRASLTLAETGDVARALAQRNPEVSPHLSFLDLGGHGYGLVTVTADGLETEFVAIPRPLERSERPDGGPLAYRVVHRTRMWAPGEAPRLEQQVLEGEPPLAL
jgi:alkaline phosphatase D